jgi:hypothetical protein
MSSTKQFTLHLGHRHGPALFVSVLVLISGEDNDGLANE